MNDAIPFDVIGCVHSCFKEKFGIPCQPGLATEAKATIEIFAPYNRPEAFEGLQASSHLWLQFIFHKAPSDVWRPTVRPPRLGGNKRMGVFATRAPVRPNPLGLSVVKLDSIRFDQGVLIEVSGIDLLDKTPIVDIKPYIPYVDCVQDASNEFAKAPRAPVAVDFCPSVLAPITEYSQDHSINLRLLLEQVLQQDPRPQYQSADPERVYGMRLLDLEVKWVYKTLDSKETVFVVSISAA